MGFNSNVIQAASRQLEEQRNRREADFAARQAKIYREIPRTAEIDRELRSTAADAAAAALRTGTDPSRAIGALRDRNLALQKERRSLLLSHGYSERALVNDPACPDCGDTGWKGAAMCRCLKALCAKEQIRQLSSMLDLQGHSFDSFQFDLYSDQKDQEHGGLSPRQNMEFVYSICKQYAEAFPDFPYFRNLLLSGSPGLGKTFLSASIARVVSERGYSVVYDTAANLFAQFEARKFQKDPAAEESTYRYLQCDLLILDDLGTEMRTSFTQSVLYDILNSRLISDQHTIISSNLSPAQIQKAYLPQIYSRLSGSYRSLPFYGEDIRLLKKNQII